MSPSKAIRCVMLGLGGPEWPFILDWAKAVSAFAEVEGITLVDRLPNKATVVAPGCGLGNVGGVKVAFVRMRNLRPSRLLWRVGVRLEAKAVQRGLAALGGQPPDVIHGHFYAASGGIPRVAARLGIPYVVTEHSVRLATERFAGSVSRQGLSLMRQVYGPAAAVFLVGHDQFEAAQSLELPGNFTIIPNPVDVEIFRSATGETHPPRIVTVGRLVERKRHDLALRAFALLKKNHDRFTFAIIGDGPKMQELRRLAADLGVGESVKFSGYLTRPEVAAHLQGAVAYIHTADHETFGVSIVEALAAGVPVVTSRCGGATEALPSSVAVVVEEATPEKLAAGLERVISSGTTLQPRDAIAAWANGSFGMEAVSKSIRDKYRAVLRL